MRGEELGVYKLKWFFLFIAVCLISCKTAPGMPEEAAPPVQEAAVIQEPEFSITSIAIIRGELVNVTLRVGMKIENPNPFPVTLAAFSYTLYGNGRFWASDSSRDESQDSIAIAAESTEEDDFFLTLNFIDMDRQLLDQFIRLENVHYRFTGSAGLSVEAQGYAGFTSNFDLSGFTQVLDR